MMKNFKTPKPIPWILGLTFIIATFFILFKHPKQNTHKNIDVHRNGAYDALNQFALARTYPFEELPAKAHYDAWASLQIRTRQTNANLPETAPWEMMGPLNIGGRTLKIAFNPQNPQTMYAGSASGGLWRSYSGGIGVSAWEYVPTGFPILGVSAITFAPGDSMIMYIGTGEVYNHQASGVGAAYRNARGSYGIGILKSTDGGKTWQKSLDWSYDQNRGIWDIKVSELNPNIIYAATTDGVYKSTDAGAIWNKVHDVVMATSIIVHPQDDNKVLVGCGNFQSPGYGIYRTINGGNNWVKIRSTLPLNFRGKVQLEYAPTNPDIVYASIGNGFSFADGASWLCKTEDFGSSWKVQNTRDYSRWQGWFSHDVAVNPQNADDLAIVGINVWKSADAGLTLDSVAVGGITFGNLPLEGPDGPPNYVHSDCHDVIYHPENPNIFYIANDGGIHYTTDNGTTYRSLNGGYASVQFYNGFSNSFQDSTFCLGGLQDNGSIHWNGDLTWTRISGGDGSWSAIDPTNDNIIYTSSQYLNIRRSNDRGKNFQWIIPPTNNEFASFIAPFIVSQSHPTVIYAGRNNLYKSGDRGQNWTIVSDPTVLSDNNPIFSMAVSPETPDIVYVATAPTTLFGGGRGHVYVTTNGGREWFNITGSLPDRYPMDMAIDPTNNAIAYIGFSGYGTGHIFKTTDYGRNWQDISQNLPDVPVNAIVVDPEFPNNIYVGNDLGVFASVDGGISWNTYQDGLYDATMIFALSISPTNRKLRAATHGNGAFQRDLLEVSPTLPNDNELGLQIFPNPADDFAIMSFQLQEERQITARIFDLRGRLVRDVYNESKPAGTHRLNIDMRTLASATYVLQVEVGGIVVNKKLVVAR